MSAFGGFEPLPLRLGASGTDGLAAAQHARICADLVALSRVEPFAVITFKLQGDPAAPVILAYNSMVCVGKDPVRVPLILVVTDSVFTIKWNESEFDAYERPEPLAIRHAQAFVCGPVAAFITVDWNQGESSVEVHVFDNNGDAAMAAQAITVAVT